MKNRTKPELAFLASKYNFDDNEAANMGFAIGEVLDALFIEYKRKHISDKKAIGSAAIQLLDDICNWRDSFRNGE